jgi:hypothetical protein
MSTRVIATARLNATCRRELCEKLRLDVDPASELSRLNSIIGSGQLTLSDLQQLVSAPSACSMLSTLAPEEFSRVCGRLNGGSRFALETTAADLQAELAETMAAADSVVMAAARGITANTFTKSGLELGYSVTTHHSESVTCVELRRGHEIVLVGIQDGGNVEIDHSGLSDDASRGHQLQLERAARRHGVCLAQRP